MASLHILPSVLIGLYIIIETIANLAVGADILDLLLRVCAPDANALCPLLSIAVNFTADTIEATLPDLRTLPREKAPWYGVYFESCIGKLVSYTSEIHA